MMTFELVLIYGLMFVSISALAWLFYFSSKRGLAAYQAHFTQDLAGKFHTMFMFIDGRKMFVINLIAIAILPVIVYFLSGNWVFVVIAAIVAIAFPRAAVYLLRKRRMEQFVQHLPDSLMQIAGGMRAGGSFAIAVEVVSRESTGPISQELTLLLRELRMGVSLDEALENLGNRVPAQEMILVVSAARVARDVGGNLAETFERLAETLRQKMAMEGKIKALTSQGKLQGWVVGALPFGIMLILFQMEPVAMRPLLHSALGWAFLGIIIILELLGMMMIRKIVAIDV